MANLPKPETHASHQTDQADARYTREIARFVSGLTYERLPDEVRQRIKLLILDSLGCGIYGAVKPHSEIATRSIVSIDDSKTCGLWGTSQRACAPHAALLNGTYVQGFEI